MSLIDKTRKQIDQWLSFEGPIFLIEHNIRICSNRIERYQKMLVKGKVKKEVKNSLRELEHTLRNTNRPKGNPQFVGGVQEDPESYVGQGWSLDV